MPSTLKAKRYTFECGEKGYTIGPLAIFKKRLDGWNVIHLASKLCIHRGGSFGSLADAKAYAAGFLDIPGVMAYLAFVADQDHAPIVPNIEEVERATREYAVNNGPLRRNIYGDLVR